MDIAFDVLPAHQRDVVAEFGDEHVDQLSAVFVFLGGHLFEYFGAGGIVHAQAFGVIGVDSSVFLLVADGQREQFAFGEIGEFAHTRVPEMA